MNFDELPFNFRYFIKELEKRHIKCRAIDGTDIIEANFKGHIEWFLPAENRLIPSNYNHLFRDKYYLKKIFQDKNFSVQDGKVFHKQMQAQALDYAQFTLQFPVVIKPPNLANGDGVFVNIRDKAEFSAIWRSNIQSSFQQDYFIVEKYFDPSDDYMFFIMEENSPVVFKRSPPKVVGDGKHSLQKLIEIENHRRMNPRTSCLCDIFLDDPDGKRALKHQFQRLSDIIPEGKEVLLRYNSNVSYGGFCENVTNQTHESYKALVKSIFDLFPGLPYARIDLFSKDISAPVEHEMYAVNEIETALSLSMFAMPAEGEGVNILSPIIDRLFPETKENAKN